MSKYILFYGMGGGFGGADAWEVVEYDNIKQANDAAYYAACENYENYAGSNGVRSMQDIMEEDDCDEEYAEQIFNDERESWIDYRAELLNEEEHEEYIKRC